jgi:hypothetical protein
MSGKYVPPSRRNAVSTNASAIPIQNEYFPPLSTNTRTIAPTKSGISFSALASEWNEKDVEDETERKSREEFEKNRAERADADTKRAFASLRREYNNPEPYVYAVDEDDAGALLDKVTDDGWKTVDKKTKKQWSYEEQMERRRKFEEAEARMNEDSSVWQSGEHRSEDWSHRDRRTL